MDIYAFDGQFVGAGKLFNGLALRDRAGRELRIRLGQSMRSAVAESSWSATRRHLGLATPGISLLPLLVHSLHQFRPFPPRPGDGLTHFRRPSAFERLDRFDECLDGLRRR